MSTTGVIYPPAVHCFAPYTPLYAICSVDVVCSCGTAAGGRMFEVISVVLAIDGRIPPNDATPATERGRGYTSPTSGRNRGSKRQGEKVMADSSGEQKLYNLTPIRRAVLTACGATVGVTAAPAAVAQEAAAQEALGLEEIIVTARKRTENLQDVPISVLAFSSDAIVRQGIKSLEDYARLIPSLTYSSWMPGNSIVVFRGVTVTADAFTGTSSAAIFFNEVPITTQGLNPEVATLDMERIEAVSGPQPTTYGASAQSGVLKFITAPAVLGEFGGFVDVAGSAMEEGDPGYDLQGAVNIPLVEDKLALRVAGQQSKVGGYVDNISGSSADSHDWTPAFESDAGLAAYPGGFGAPSNIAHVTKTNHDVAEDNVGGIETEVLRLTAAWQPNDAWLVTGMVNFQSMYVDGISTWHPELGDLNQIRFRNETKDDDWYITTLIVEGDLGFADLTSATGYMDREIVYDLDSSTYLHQFQGIGAVLYNSFDIAYFPYYNITAGYTAYNGSITGWAPGPGLSVNGYPTYYITELTDNTSSMWNRDVSDRFTQELRLTSKDEGQRYQWMIGGFYQKFDSSYVFRNIIDNFGDSLVGQQLGLQGFTARSPGQSWYGTGTTDDKEWAVFAEFGFDITDNLNILLGARYFESDAETYNLTLNADGTTSQNCLEEIIGGEGVCILSPSNVTADNRIGTAPAFSSAENSDTLPLATITYSFNDDILTYFTYSEGFRVGGTNILRATSTASKVYDPDKVINNEIGLKTTLWDGRFVWNMAAYKMTWEDMQLVAADPTISLGWGQVTVNTGEAEIEGFETNFALAATEGLKFDGAFSYTTSEVTEGYTLGDDVIVAVGEQLPLSPRIKWSLGAEYSFPVRNSDGYVRLDYSYMDEQTNATQGSALLTSSTLLRGTITTMPSYSIANLIAGIEKDTWSIRFALNNIADERAVTYVPTRWTDGRQYSVRPREFTVSYRKNF